MMPGRRKRRNVGRGMGKGMGQGQGMGRGMGNRSSVGMDDLKTGVSLLKSARKLFIPLAAAVAADLKNPDGVIRKQLTTLKNKIPFKIHTRPEEMEQIENGPEQKDGQKQLPPIKIDATSKPIEK